MAKDAESLLSGQSHVLVCQTLQGSDNPQQVTCNPVLTFPNENIELLQFLTPAMNQLSVPNDSSCLVCSHRSEQRNFARQIVHTTKYLCICVCILVPALHNPL
jgi:hypothetical protein